MCFMGRQLEISILNAGPALDGSAQAWVKKREISSRLCQILMRLQLSLSSLLRAIFGEMWCSWTAGSLVSKQQALEFVNGSSHALKCSTKGILALANGKQISLR